MAHKQDIKYSKDALSVVDEWMSKLGAEDSGVAIKLSQPQAAEVETTGKSTLGLGKKRSHDEVKKDELKQRIEKNEKMKEKKKKQLADEDNIIRDLHGVVEMEEESKIRPARPIQTITTSSPIAKSNYKGYIASKITNKVKHSSTQAPTKHQPSNDYSKAPLIPSTNELNTTNTLPNTTDTIVKPKKHKTRSKQKNIRKDNRSNDLKPKHLQIGSEDYNGRTLTQVILSLATSIWYDSNVTVPLFIYNATDI